MGLFEGVVDVIGEVGEGGGVVEDFGFVVFADEVYDDVGVRDDVPEASGEPKAGRVRGATKIVAETTC